MSPLGKTVLLEGDMILDTSGGKAMLSLWAGGNQARSRGPRGWKKGMPNSLTFSLQSKNQSMQSVVGLELWQFSDT